MTAAAETCGKQWLNEAQRRSWADDGLLVLENAFTSVEVAELRTEADRLLELAINSSLFHNRRSERLDWRLREDGKQLIRKIQPINDMSLAFAAVSDDPRMKGPLAELMGEPAVLFEEKLNYKHPLMHSVEGLEELDGTHKNASARPDADWGQHNDYAYYIAQDYPKESISTALVLDDCTLANGALIMWPKSHMQHRVHDANSDLGGAQDVHRTGELGVDPRTGWRTGPGEKNPRVVE